VTRRKRIVMQALRAMRAVGLPAPASRDLCAVWGHSWMATGSATAHVGGVSSNMRCGRCGDQKLHGGPVRNWVVTSRPASVGGD
jgi:hypothetical protein